MMMIVHRILTGEEIGRSLMITTFYDHHVSSGRGAMRNPTRYDDFDSTKGGFNSARAGSASAHRFSNNQN